MDEKTEATEVQQHLGWLKMYIEGMTPENWRDMRDHADRQLKQLIAALNAEPRLS